MHITIKRDSLKKREGDVEVVISNSEKVVWQGKADRIFLPLVGGDVVVMGKHAPMVGVLSEGTLKIYGEQETSFDVSRGIVKVKEDVVDVLIR